MPGAAPRYEWERPSARGLREDQYLWIIDGLSYEYGYDDLNTLIMMINPDGLMRHIVNDLGRNLARRAKARLRRGLDGNGLRPKSKKRSKHFRETGLMIKNIRYMSRRKWIDVRAVRYPGRKRSKKNPRNWPNTRLAMVKNIYDEKWSDPLGVNSEDAQEFAEIDVSNALKKHLDNNMKFILRKMDRGLEVHRLFREGALRYQAGLSRD